MVAVSSILILPPINVGERVGVANISVVLGFYKLNFTLVKVLREYISNAFIPLQINAKGHRFYNWKVK